MGKKARLKAKRPGRCIFCEGANLTKEHFWSEWVSPFLPNYADNRRVEERLTWQNGFLIAPPELSSRQGHTWTKKIRAVCRKCNNEWMSALDNTAKRVLTPLIVSQPMKLSIEDVRVVAQWIALKVMIGERNHPEDAVTSREDRMNFKATLEVPQGFKIWIGRCGVPGWNALYHRHAATIGTSPIVTPSHRFKNIHSVAFAIRDLFVFALYTSVAGVLNSAPTQSQALTRVFPPTGPVDWPPPRSLTAAEATAIALTLPREFRSPNVRWAPGFPP